MPKTTEIISVNILQMHIICAIIKLGGDISTPQSRYPAKLIAKWTIKQKNERKELFV